MKKKTISIPTVEFEPVITVSKATTIFIIGIVVNIILTAIYIIKVVKGDKYSESDVLYRELVTIKDCNGE